MIDLIIPDDMIEGTSCLELGLPWMTPSAIHKLDDILKPTDMVLEVGTGGSTIFFAKRCKSVIAIETSYEWAEKVEERVDKEGLLSVYFYKQENEELICRIMGSPRTEEITVLSIDPEGCYNRSKILNAFIDNRSLPALRMIIVDNYAHEGLFPDHWNKKVIDHPDWGYYEYNHPRWAGSGTAIYVKKEN